MMSRQDIFEGTTKLIAVFFASASGFWAKIAPPESQDAKFSIGIAVSILWVISLVIQAFTPSPLSAKSKRFLKIVTGISSAIFIVFAFLYYHSFHKLTFVYPANTPQETRYIKGEGYAIPAQEYLKEHPYTNDEELVKEFGLENINYIWTQDSIANARETLVFDYILLVTSLCATILCVLEIAYKKESKKNK